MSSQFRSCLSTGTTIALATLVAGTLDIADALIFTSVMGGHPAGVLRFIAACLLGRGALRGGIGMAALGLLLHFIVALCWCGLFVLASQRVGFLRRYPAVSGVAYGLVIWAIMNLVVLPNTAMHVHLGHAVPALMNGVAALVLFVGLPVALINTQRCQT